MNHTNALLPTLTKPNRRATRTKARVPGQCERNAPCGQRCCCEREIVHVYHICRQEGCYCHSRERYEEGRRT